MITCNDCENEKQFSVEKILEKSSSSKTSKSFPLKFGVEKLLNNDEIKITDRSKCLFLYSFHIALQYIT